MQSQPYRLLDESEYLALEARSPVRHEYVAGEIFAMTGASVRHNIIAGNLYTALRTHLRGTPCRALMEGVKLYLKKERSYFYPDVMVTCESRLLELDAETQLVDSPALIIEVLSPSTEGIDRREKLFAYQTITSLHEYLLVDPDKRCVEVYRFGEKVRHETYTEGSFRLDCLDAVVALDEVYIDAEAV